MEKSERNFSAVLLLAYFRYLEITKNWSICLSVRPWFGVHTNVSNGSESDLGSGSSKIYDKN